MSRFPIHIDPVWSVPLLLIGATHERSYVEVGETELEITFGIGTEKVAIADIASVAPHEWSAFYGIGHRVGYGGMGYIGSTDNVVKITFKRPLSFNLLLGFHKDFTSFFVSVDDPAAFIAAVQARIT